jgi:hypothetical protein
MTFGMAVISKMMDSLDVFMGVPVPNSISDCLLFILFLPVTTLFITISVFLVCIVLPFTILILGLKERLFENGFIQKYLEKFKKSGVYKLLFDEY